MTDDKQLSLYDRLGGVFSIATVVDDIIDRIMDDFQQTLDKFEVPDAEQKGLKTIVNSTYDDIVLTPS